MAYASNQVIGQGSFGRVFLVRLVGGAGLLLHDENTDGGTFFAMKVLRKPDVARRHQVENALAERRILASLDHPLLLKLRFAFQTPEKLYLVTDYCQGGELFFHLKRLRRISLSMVRFLAAELVLALGYLHDRDIIYRDLKVRSMCASMRAYWKGRAAWEWS